MTAEAVATPRVSRGPWATAMRRLARDRAGMAALALFCVILVLCLLAPVYAALGRSQPFHAPPSAPPLIIDGKTVPVMEQSTEGLGLGYNPIGPTWRLGNYFLGADNQGRDVMARLLYGGLTSLLIAGAATVLTLSLATIVGLVAGFFGGLTDIILAAHSRCLVGFSGLSPRHFAFDRADCARRRDRADHH